MTYWSLLFFFFLKKIKKKKNSVTLAVASIVSGILTGRFGHIKIHIILGAVSLVVATYLITTIKLNTVYWYELIIILLYGFGVGMANQNYLVIGQNAVPKPCKLLKKK